MRTLVLEPQERNRIRRESGVKGFSGFIELSSIRFPESFAIDGMHQWGINADKVLFNFQRGCFWSTAALRQQAAYAGEQGQANAMANRELDEDDDRNDEFPETSSDKDEAVGINRPRGMRDRPPKFRKTPDPFCLHPNIWTRIGNDMEETRARKGIPEAFGTNISLHCHHYKAERDRTSSPRRLSITNRKHGLPTRYNSDDHTDTST